MEVLKWTAVTVGDTFFLDNFAKFIILKSRLKFQVNLCQNPRGTKNFGLSMIQNVPRLLSPVFVFL